VTAFLFGDACSATLVSVNPNLDDTCRLSVPDILSVADPTKSIRDVQRKIVMDGMAVARAASMTMSNLLERTAEAQGVRLNELDYLIPHPGSVRVVKNVASFLGIEPARVLSTLAETGNTSSSSIPIVLAHEWGELKNKTVGFVAFGAGYTAAACISHPLTSSSSHIKSQ
jgi:3-oxoacyl-[acyl-carrier-protein] synthase III